MGSTPHGGGNAETFNIQLSTHNVQRKVGELGNCAKKLVDKNGSLSSGHRIPIMV